MGGDLRHLDQWLAQITTVTVSAIGNLLTAASAAVHLTDILFQKLLDYE
jgi:hypothetical protein